MPVLADRAVLICDSGPNGFAEQPIVEIAFVHQATNVPPLVPYVGHMHSFGPIANEHSRHVALAALVGVAMYQLVHMRHTIGYLAVFAAYPHTLDVWALVHNAVVAHVVAPVAVVVVAVQCCRNFAVA